VAGHSSRSAKLPVALSINPTEVTHMHSTPRYFIVSLAIAAFSLCSAVAAQDAFVGSWVLDPARSTAPPGLAPTAGTLDIANAGDGKFTSVSEASVGGVTGRSEITYAVDGNDYTTTSTPAVTGAPTVTQAIERVSATVYKMSVKANGQLIATALTEISGNGDTLTQTTTGVGQLAALSSTLVFRRK
jgi:hypothetical protein